jgi:hypothetical protein
MEPAFGLPAAWRAPRALRRDLENAGLPFEDESGRRFDFHALRGMLATRLLSAGASVRAAQSLMRHSTAELTVSVYARVRAGEEREALERMPDLFGDASEALRPTGTAGVADGCGQWHRDDANGRTGSQDHASTTVEHGPENPTPAPAEVGRTGFDSRRLHHPPLAASPRWGTDLRQRGLARTGWTWRRPWRSRPRIP